MGVPFAIIAGDEEKKRKTAVLKDMYKKTQVEVPLKDLSSKIKNSK